MLSPDGIATFSVLRTSRSSGVAWLSDSVPSLEVETPSSSAIASRSSPFANNDPDKNRADELELSPGAAWAAVTDPKSIKDVAPTTAPSLNAFGLPRARVEFMKSPNSRRNDGGERPASFEGRQKGPK
ncbi:hypothetical protein GCM10011313_18590 [Mycetocola zhadangensis]|nr:hypothetical protein GCM10011313_18590 [Mycetocola zhadangensis]